MQYAADSKEYNKAKIGGKVKISNNYCCFYQKSMLSYYLADTRYLKVYFYHFYL